MTTPITITLNRIRAHSPCADGWRKILAAKCGQPHDTPFPLADALDSNGLDDTLWALRCLPEHNNLWRKYAVWCARQAQHLMTDERSLRALDVAWAHSDGLATDAELDAAARAAAAAAWAAEAAEAAKATAWAARAAAEAARAAGWAAAEAAARAAAEAARAAGWAAWATARAAQTTKLREILNAGQWVE